MLRAVPGTGRAAKVSGLQAGGLREGFLWRTMLSPALLAQSQVSERHGGCQRLSGAAQRGTWSCCTQQGHRGGGAGAGGMLPWNRG